MPVIFNIARQDPQGNRLTQRYELAVEPGETVLDCLMRIKGDVDGSLAFRKNCRNTICGSCAMTINGRATLACKENVEQELARFGGQEIAIAPMQNLPIIRDLVVDMTPFWQDLERVEPYVSTQGRAIPEREFLQSPAARSQLDQTGNCILCGACYSECNTKAVNPQFVGPHALAKAQRLVADTRDTQAADRLAQQNNTDGVWGCTRCYQCNAVCPMNVEPMAQISRLKREILADASPDESRPIRHRKVLVQLVKAGGWVDERQFGVRVIGNQFRDWRGLLSVMPLGFRLLSRGKFPFTFEASEGTEQVRNLINAVQAKRQPPAPQSDV